MGSAYLETPQFGGEYTPQLKLEVSTYYDSRTTIHVDWTLRYEQYGTDPHWGTMWVWFGRNSDHQIDLVEFEGDGEDKSWTYSETIDREQTGFNVPVWLSCDMSDCYFGGSYGEEWTGDNCIGGDYFGVNPIDPPNAPTSISAARGANNNTVTVTLGNSTDADGTQIQVSANRTDWTSFRSTTTGGAITTYTGTLPSSMTGVVYFHARNVAAGVYSEWSPISDGVQLLSAPNPPTLLTPRDGAVFEVGQELTFKWTHNPVDGTTQSGYAFVLDGVQQSTRTSTASEHSMPSGMSATGTHTWAVKTKGAASSLSQTSETRTFSVSYAPQFTVTLTSLKDGKQPTLPVWFSISKSGTDQQSEIVGFTARLYDGTKLLATKELATGDGSFSVYDFDPENNKTYTIKVTARNQFGLTSTVSKTFETNFPNIMMPNVVVADLANDRNHVSVAYSIVGGGGGGSAKASEEPAVRADTYELYREVNGVRAFIGSGKFGENVWHIDKWIPLVRNFAYIVVAKRTNEGTSAVFRFDKVNGSNFDTWYLHYDIGNGNKMVKKKWNPSGSWGITRPQRTRVLYDGRKLPVSYDGPGINRTMSQTFELLTLDEVREVEEFMALGGRGYYRSCDGFAGWVDVDVSFSPKYTDSGHYGTCTFAMTQIDGDAL